MSGKNRLGIALLDTEGPTTAPSTQAKTPTFPAGGSAATPCHTRRGTPRFWPPAPARQSSLGAELPSFRLEIRLLQSSFSFFGQ
jgi:hypothetical protein